MMDINNDLPEALPQEFERAIVKLDKQDLRSEAQEGWGATTGGKAVTSRYHARLTDAITVSLLGSWGGTDVQRLVATLKKLPADLIALSCLQNVLNSIALQHPLRNTLLMVGNGIANELWAAKLTHDNPVLAAKIERAARARHSGSERRVNAARRAAFNAGYSHREWSKAHQLKAGAFLWNVLSTALPDVFEMACIPGTKDQYGNPKIAVTLTDNGNAVVDGALDLVIGNNPVFWPSAEVPKAWEGNTGGGSHDERVNAGTKLVRSRHKGTHAAVRFAIKSGAMKPALDAVNTLQSVAFKINPKILEVIDTLVGCGALGVPGFPEVNAPRHQKVSDSKWARMSKRDKAISGAQREAVRKHNLGLIGDRVLMREDMITANAMAALDRFYTPMNLDWRGRVYALSHFNFQREDRVRALFLFADGTPIGEEGLKYLKRHTANCGDFKVGDHKISKRSMGERETWCDTNRQLITNIASVPLVHTEWMQADKPFLFLAACFELTSAWDVGPSYTTRLPISFDGSCSGLQHLCAMTRATEGSMVNLTSSPLPQDVYQVVATDTWESISKVEGDDAELAKLFMEWDGDRRKGVKRNVMTYSYSSKKFGMAGQQQVDLMDPLSREVLKGKLQEHPFVGYEQGTVERPSRGARFLASHVFDAIETRIHLPAQAMKFLQSIAKAMAHESKPVQWTTPVGLPWINRYHEAVVDRVQLFLNDGGVKRRTDISIATGDHSGIDKAKAANGVAPNFVHALDASHLLLVANAASAAGVHGIATVHDSFGCLAPHAPRFNTIIREQFALMYETHDVLTQIHERASADLTDANRNKLPERITYGTLNLKDILHADFAFA